MTNQHPTPEPATALTAQAPICAVSGLDPDNQPIPPCTQPATVTTRFQCAEGHERQRTTCEFHANRLRWVGILGTALCLVCYETTGTEVRIVPID